MTVLSDPRTRHLVATLERYLDFAGDTRKTAGSLYLHRTSLYQRLRRVERLAGVDLANGDDRLALHLSLKLARLQGMTWADQDGADDHQG
jgi:DNA-binding PucR family transcriptional regulator